MRYPALTSLTITASLILSIYLFVPGNIHAAASNGSLEDQVAGILFEETAKGNIKVVILDFIVSTAPGEGILPDKELKDRGTQYTEEFIADLISKIKDAGKRDKISIIDQGRLDDILRERKLSATDSTERTAIEIGRIAGVDAIIAGRVQLTGKIMTATAKVVRVKDGEILDIAKQDRQEKPSPIVQTPVIILETVEKIDIGSYKAHPLNLPSGGTLSVTIDVLRGNPVDVAVIPGQELENFKAEKKFNNAAGFMATKMRSYKRSAEVGKGDYYLVVRDSSLGIFSARHSEIKIIVQMEP